MNKFCLYIIGGNGFIGKNLVRIYYGKYKIIVVDKFIDSNYFSPYPEVTKVQLDLINEQIPENYPNPDFIINLVSIVNGERNTELFDELINSNIRVLLNLYNRFSNNTLLKLFVQFGSIEEYGNISTPFTENMRELPTSPYALVKQLTTNTALMLHSIYGFPITVVRPGNLFGPFQNSDKFIPYIIENLIKNKKLDITPCNHKREFIYVDDFAFMIEGILNKYPNTIGEIINVSSGESVSLRSIIEYCKRKIGSTSILNYGALVYRENEIMDQKSSIDKLINIIKKPLEINLFARLDVLIEHKIQELNK